MLQLNQVTHEDRERSMNPKSKQLIAFGFKNYQVIIMFTKNKWRWSIICMCLRAIAQCAKNRENCKIEVHRACFQLRSSHSGTSHSSGAAAATAAGTHVYTYIYLYIYIYIYTYIYTYIYVRIVGRRKRVRFVFCPLTCVVFFGISGFRRRKHSGYYIVIANAFFLIPRWIS